MTAIRIIDDHIELANIGSNTHEQIDNHIASTSNPHGVTKAQVGLGNVADGAEVNVQSNWNATDGDAFILNKPSDLTVLSGHNVTELSDVTNAGSGIIISAAERTKLNGIEESATADQTKTDIDTLGLSHDSLTDVSANDHHTELHSIASHNDTSATGAQLDTLTDNSIANTLHRHSELVASDGSPDPVVSVNSSGRVGIGIASAVKILHVVEDSTNSSALFETKSGTDNWLFFANPVSMAAGGDNDAGFGILNRDFHFRAGDHTRVMIQGTTGNIGLATVNPTRILGITGLAAKNIGMERGTVANTAGFNLTLNAGGATSAATDKAGGDLILDAGISTGSAESGVQIRGCVAGATGTADRTLTTAIRVLGNKIGFYNITPTARQVLATGASATVDDVITALQTLGLVKQS